jgi:hypothetical protein
LISLCAKNLNGALGQRRTRIWLTQLTPKDHCNRPLFHFRKISARNLLIWHEAIFPT